MKVFKIVAQVRVGFFCVQLYIQLLDFYFINFSNCSGASQLKSKVCKFETF